MMPDENQFAEVHGDAQLITVRCICGAETTRYRILRPHSSCPSCGIDWNVILEVLERRTLNDETIRIRLQG